MNLALTLREFVSLHHDLQKLPDLETPQGQVVIAQAKATLNKLMTSRLRVITQAPAIELRKLPEFYKVDLTGFHFAFPFQVHVVVKDNSIEIANADYSNVVYDLIVKESL